MVYVARSPTNIAVRSTDALTATSPTPGLCATVTATLITSTTKTTKPRNHETVRSAKELVKKYDVERRTRRTRRRTLSIFLCGFRGFCVVRDFFTRSKAFALHCAEVNERLTQADRCRESARRAKGEAW